MAGTVGSERQLIGIMNPDDRFRVANSAWLPVKARPLAAARAKKKRPLAPDRGEPPPTVAAAAHPASQVYFLSGAFFSAGALDADFAIDVVGTMMWA